MNATTLDDLVSMIGLHLDLNDAQIREMSASVFDLHSDYTLEEITIKGWRSSPMKLLEDIWEYVAWTDGRTLCDLRQDNTLPGLRVLLQGPDDSPEGPIFCDICINVQHPSPRRDDKGDV